MGGAVGSTHFFANLSTGCNYALFRWQKSPVGCYSTGNSYRWNIALFSNLWYEYRICENSSGKNAIPAFIKSTLTIHRNILLVLWVSIRAQARVAFM